MERAVSGRDSSHPWWLYAEWVPLTLMPWALLSPLLLSKTHRSEMFAGAVRPLSGGGRTLVLVYLAVGLILMTAVAQKSVHYLLPVVPALMLPTAIAYREIEARHPNVFDWFYVGLAAAVLVALVAGSFLLDRLPDDARFWWIAPEPAVRRALGAAALAVLPLAIAARLRGEARVIANIASLAVFVFALKATLLPDVNRSYSVTALASAFEPLVPAGTEITVYGLPRGSLSYGFSDPLRYVADLPNEAPVAPHKLGSYVITSERRWLGAADLFAAYAVLGRRHIETTEVLLLHRTAD
jgi:hypothetical protein